MQFWKINNVRTNLPQSMAIANQCLIRSIYQLTFWTPFVKWINRQTIEIKKKRRCGMIVHETAINEMTVESYLLRVLLINFCLECISMISSVYGFSIKYVIIYTNYMYIPLYTPTSLLWLIYRFLWHTEKDLTSNYPPIHSLEPPTTTARK